MTVNQYAYTQRLTRSKKDPVRNYSSSDRILAGKAYLQDIVDPKVFKNWAVNLATELEHSD